MILALIVVHRSARIRDRCGLVPESNSPAGDSPKPAVRRCVLLLVYLFSNEHCELIFVARRSRRLQEKAREHMKRRHSDDTSARGSAKRGNTRKTWIKRGAGS